ncbi:MAG: hypothetical protein AB8I08_07960 [Sandaracinaceae bacterium]
MSATLLEDGLRLDASLDPDTDQVDMHLALLEPLGLDAGGVHHEGGDVWPSRDEDGYRCLRAWLADVPDEGACGRAAPDL